MSKPNGKNGLNRRHFLASAAAATTAVSALSAPGSRRGARVVVGGGRRRATAARYSPRIRKCAIDVTLGNRAAPIHLLLLKLYTRLPVRVDRAQLRRAAANHASTWCTTGVSFDRRRARRGARGRGAAPPRPARALAGIDFRDGSVPGWDLSHQNRMPHAYKPARRPAAQGADHARRRHLLHGRAVEPLPLPAGALRADLDGGPRPEAVQSDGEDHHRRPQGEVLQAGAVRGRLAAPLPRHGRAYRPGLRRRQGRGASRGHGGGGGRRGDEVGV